MDLLWILIFTVFAVLFSVLRRVYSFASGKRLFGEELETQYQRTFTQISHNKNIINFGLWTFIVLSSSISLILIENYTDSWIAVFIFIIFISAIFIYLANYQPRGLSLNLAKIFAGRVAKIASASKKYFKFIPKASQAQSALQVYDKTDLVDFFQAQKSASSNMIDEGLLKLLNNIAERSDLQAGDIMTGLKKVRTIDSEQEIGPVIIDELHKTGGKYFLVEDKKTDELIGYVKLRDLTSLKSSGRIRESVNRELEYVEINDDILELIETFLAGSCPVFLVRDSGETIGMVTIDDCLEKLLF